MSANIGIEARLLMASIGTGTGLMAIYDLLRLWRIVIRHSWFVVGIEDLCYWIFAGLTTFYLLYLGNDGTIRLYLIGSVLLAMLGYEYFFHSFLRKTLKKLVGCFRMKKSGRV